ncbi:hypothetical protein [Halonotius roseus]|uniref:Uncharacterized protein n=1 Tax=Halonotius roseus TaxID=2511997 RepID=A0A544QR05_9EURY|nr:hypothetical protein [Halonotius roseus]TQQ81870.1 hypothetical protein EWF95_02730 [Halonotius roseus]
MGFEIEGLDNLKDHLEDIADLEGGVPMEEMFPPEFMKMYTQFESFDQFLEESTWTVESQEDFEAIPESEFDDYVDQTTEFPQWQTMLETGGKKYLQRKLGN